MKYRRTVHLNFLPPKFQISVPVFIEIGTLKGTFRIQVPFKMFIVYTLLQKECLLISSSSPGDAWSLTLCSVEFVKWSQEG